MKTYRNKLVECLQSGKPAFGNNIHCGDFAGARSAGDSEFEFIKIDLEHEGFDMPQLGNTMQWLVSMRRIAAAGTAFASPTPIVRLPHHGTERTRWITSQVLDYGALCVVVPYVETAADVEFMVETMRYSRRVGNKIVGERRVWPKMAMRYWGYTDFDEYREMADLWPLAPNGELLLIIIVATPKALRNIDEIAAVPGLSGIMFGAKHAWNAFGRSGTCDLEDPEIADFRSRMLAACKKNGIAAGTPLSGSAPRGAGGKGMVDIPFLKRRIDEGYRLFLAQGIYPKGY